MSSPGCTCKPSPSHPILYIDPYFHLTSWEFVLNFDYEYLIMMGKRKFTRTVLVRALSALIIWEVFEPAHAISFTWRVAGSPYWL
jgi:hypothetical protein